MDKQTSANYRRYSRKAGLDVLTLPIKKCWFDMIVSGVKNEEYRDCTDFYLKRFHHLKMTMVDGKAKPLSDCETAMAGMLRHA